MACLAGTVDDGSNFSAPCLACPIHAGADFKTTQKFDFGSRPVWTPRSREPTRHSAYRHPHCAHTTRQQAARLSREAPRQRLRDRQSAGRPSHWALLLPAFKIEAGRRTSAHPAKNRPPPNCAVTESLSEQRPLTQSANAPGFGPYYWWRMTGSNRRPSACKAVALPTELIPQTFKAAGRICIRLTNPRNPREYRLTPHPYQGHRTCESGFWPFTAALKAQESGGG